MEVATIIWGIAIHRGIFHCLANNVWKPVTSRQWFLTDYRWSRFAPIHSDPATTISSTQFTIVRKLQELGHVWKIRQCIPHGLSPDWCSALHELTHAFRTYSVLSTLTGWIRSSQEMSEWVLYVSHSAYMDDSGRKRPPTIPKRDLHTENVEIFPRRSRRCVLGNWELFPSGSTTKQSIVLQTTTRPQPCDSS